MAIISANLQFNRGGHGLLDYSSLQKNYSTALLWAQDANSNAAVGQFIYLEETETIGEVTYAKGPYVVDVIGEGAVLTPLSKSVAGEQDLSGAITDLKTEVGKIKTEVDALPETFVTDVKDASGNTMVTDGVVTLGDYATKKDLEDAIGDIDFSTLATKEEVATKADSDKVYSKDSADATFVKIDGYVAYSDDEKTKLAGIAEGAQVNVLEGVKVNDVELTIGEDKKVNIDLSAYAIADETATKSALQALEQIVNGKAESKDVYTKTEVDDTFLKIADKYNDTEVRNLITAETTARGELASTLRGEIATAQSAAEKVATDFNTAMNGRMTTVEDKVAVLEAIDHEKLVNDAIDEFASKTSDDKVVNTFAELLQYAAEHSSEYADIYGEVQGMKTSKADQTALDALNAIVGKASVEGGESGSGLVKRIEDLEDIDHDAYKAADATLKSELQVVINKKADVTSLNSEVSAREALAALVGTRDEGDTATVFEKIAAIVAKDNAQDEVIATKAAKSEVEALASLVGTRDEGDTATVFEKLATLASAVDGKLTKNATVNNVAFENGAVVIDAANITLDTAITRTEDEGVKTVYSADASIQSVLKSLSERIDVLDPNVSGELGITSITEGNGISASIAGGMATIAVKVSEKGNNMLSVDGDGLFVQAITIDGNDIE